MRATEPQPWQKAGISRATWFRRRRETRRRETVSRETPRQTVQPETVSRIVG
jgi:hypothetical protein